MQHLDADDLALHALGEKLGGTVDTHVASCPLCAREVELFKLTAGLVDLSNYGEVAHRPGDHVWAAIAAELGFAESSAGPVGDHADIGGTPAGVAGAGRLPANEVSQSTSAPTAGSPRLAAVPDPGAGSTVPASTTSPTGPTGPVSQHESGGREPGGRRSGGRRSGGRYRWALPLAAAVAGLAVGAGAVAITQNKSNDTSVEAIAPLTPVQGGPLSADGKQQLGTAELVAAASGQQVRVSAPALPPTGNDYEVWLFGNDGRMVSLGTLNGGAGTFTVPNGISTKEYRVVDVSDEAPDGNPAHSGISLVRGSFS